MPKSYALSLRDIFFLQHMPYDTQKAILERLSWRDRSIREVAIKEIADITLILWNAEDHNNFVEVAYDFGERIKKLNKPSYMADNNTVRDYYNRLIAIFKPSVEELSAAFKKH